METTTTREERVCKCGYRRTVRVIRTGGVEQVRDCPACVALDRAARFEDQAKRLRKKAARLRKEQETRAPADKDGQDAAHDPDAPLSSASSTRSASTRDP